MPTEPAQKKDLSKSIHVRRVFFVVAWGQTMMTSQLGLTVHFYDGWWGGGGGGGYCFLACVVDGGCCYCC